MIPTAVSPIAMPPRICRTSGLGTAWYIAEAGCPNRTPKTQAETMNIPSAAASIRYSGQWVRRASATPLRFEIAIVAACTRLKDRSPAKYSAE